MPSLIWPVCEEKIRSIFSWEGLQVAWSEEVVAGIQPAQQSAQEEHLSIVEK